MNPKVDAYISALDQWQEVMLELQRILLDCGLEEELKWGSPCYSFQKGNVVVMGGLKDYCALGFFKGALLQDEQNILLKPGEHTQSARSIAFTSVAQVQAMEQVLKNYVFEAMEIERAGLKVEFKKTDEFPMPEELQQKLDAIPELKAAFEALTPGRQRGYLLYFADAKQSKTRMDRIDKYIPQILKGKGMLDR